MHGFLFSMIIGYNVYDLVFNIVIGIYSIISICGRWVIYIK